MATKTAKSYSRRVRSFLDSSSLPSTPSPDTKKRPRDEDEDEEPRRVVKKPKTFKSLFTSAKKPLLKPKGIADFAAPRKPLRQLILDVSSAPALLSCAKCGLNYTRGAPEDEALHKAHCHRVLQGAEWGRDEEKEALKSGVNVIDSHVNLPNGRCGRIISMRTTIGGRLGAKLETVMSTVNLALSSPPITAEALVASKAYLFLVTPPKSTKEKIVGCIIAQSIKSALKVVDEKNAGDDNLIFIDRGVFCDPKPLPTPLGISRIFVAKDHRRLGIAQALLDATACTFIHGCTLDPKKGQVAFSQPTGDGHKLMKSWGNGQVRVFEE